MVRGILLYDICLTLTSDAGTSDSSVIEIDLPRLNHFLLYVKTSSLVHSRKAGPWHPISVHFSVICYFFICACGFLFSPFVFRLIFQTPQCQTSKSTNASLDMPGTNIIFIIILCDKIRRSVFIHFFSIMCIQKYVQSITEWAMCIINLLLA